MEEDEYWIACIEEILGEAGIEAEEHKIKQIAEDVMSAAKTQSEYTTNVANKNYISDEGKELEELKRNIENYSHALGEKRTCSSCLGAGVTDFGGPFCNVCGGQGEIYPDSTRLYVKIFGV